MPIGLPWWVVARILGFYCSGCGSFPGLGRSSKLCAVASQKKGEKKNKTKVNTFTLYRRTPKKTRSGLFFLGCLLAFTSHWLLYPRIIYHDMDYLTVGVCNVLITLLVLYYKVHGSHNRPSSFFFFFFKPTYIGGYTLSELWPKWRHYCILYLNYFFKNVTKHFKTSLACDLKINFLYFWQVSFAEGFSWSMCCAVLCLIA